MGLSFSPQNKAMDEVMLNILPPFLELESFNISSQSVVFTPSVSGIFITAYTLATPSFHDVSVQNMTSSVALSF